MRIFLISIFAANIIFSTESFANQTLADLQVRLTELENLMQNITGQTEKATFKNRQLDNKVTKINKDLNMQIKEIRNTQMRILKEINQINIKLNSVNTIASTTEPTNDSRQEVTDVKQPKNIVNLESNNDKKQQFDFGNNPNKHYKIAYEYIEKGDYDAAESGMKSFLEKYPKHEFAANATYWLGETYYVREMYDKAAVEFADGYKNYPKSSKAPDNLLKLGFSMRKLGKKKEACTAFLYITNDMQDIATDSVIKTAEKEQKNLGCK